MTRRPDGALEHDIMTVLWAADLPLQPGEVQRRLDTELAYTSVATVLGRLHAKGLVDRRPAGRAFVYSAAIDESTLAAQQMQTVMAAASDRGAVLAGFVGKLSARDARALRALLDNEAR